MNSAPDRPASAAATVTSRIRLTEEGRRRGRRLAARRRWRAGARLRPGRASVECALGVRACPSSEL